MVEARLLAPFGAASKGDAFSFSSILFSTRRPLALSRRPLQITTADQVQMQMKYGLA